MSAYIVLFRTERLARTNAMITVGCLKQQMSELESNSNRFGLPYKELYILPGTKTFAEEPKFGNLLRELKSTPGQC